MLKRIRVTLALLFYTCITLLFLDFTGTLHAWLGWMAKMQFLPAILALNVGVVLFLLALTFIFGRIYCSVICPLGVMQDIVSWISGKRKKKKYRFSYSPVKMWVRYGVLGVFIMAIIAGIGSITALIAPYSAYGRIAQNLFAPLVQLGNNMLAYFDAQAESYTFYEQEVWIRSLSTFIIAIVTFVVILFLSWRKGRIYCNSICPVGTMLGFISKYALLRPVIDLQKCNSCALCSRQCKSSCINAKNHQIDYSRCVFCMDCIENCKQRAISYQFCKPHTKKVAASNAADASVASMPSAFTKPSAPSNSSIPSTSSTSSTSSASSPNAMRRQFLMGAGLLAGTLVVKAQEKTVDGGLATILDKKAPHRNTPIVPPGAQSLRHLAAHCTGCQLCVSACPNNVLRPSTGLTTLMQPESSYERGYCRPECIKCSEVCPAGAFHPITVADKSSIQIGHAVWIKENCIPLTDGVSCGNCARHCPVGAITMVLSDPNNPASLKMPAVNEERCIGCGACENLCPSRPFSAIYVEGHENHKLI